MKAISRNTTSELGKEKIDDHIYFNSAGIATDLLLDASRSKTKIYYFASARHEDQGFLNANIRSSQH